MNKRSHSDWPRFDAESLQQTIRHALASGGIEATAWPAAPSRGDTAGLVARVLRQAAGWKPGPTAGHAQAQAHGQGLGQANPAAPTTAGQNPRGATLKPPPTSVAGPGRVETHRFAGPAGSRDYTLYVPARPAAAPRPMLVMLHGCTQSAADFATGTRMNLLAEAHGFLVVYPEQGAQANTSRCWNWFRPADQRRDGGEPGLIAGIVREVAGRQGADLQRIYVAGLSAGAAMAVVLGRTHPELFAGVGAHSGLPFASAHDVPSALAAMKGGRGGGAARSPAMSRPVTAAAPAGCTTPFVPTIVIHGDRDHTVQLSNGLAVVREAVDAYRTGAGGDVLTVSHEEGRADGGRAYTRSRHVSGEGQVLVESWAVHGAGHAWAGGDAAGSYTDGRGPDASQAMVNFFLALPPARTARTAAGPEPD